MQAAPGSSGGEPPRLRFGRFFGRAASERALPGFHLAQFVPTLPKRAVATHRHDEAHFVFVLRGRYETSALPASDGTPPRIVYTPPGAAHRDCFAEGTDLARAAFAALSISPQAFVEVEKETKLPVKGVCVGGSAVPLVRQLLAESRSTDSLSESVTEELCIELLQRVGVPVEADVSGTPSWLRRARELLRDTCFDAAPRSVGEIARLLGVHPVHLARRFRRAFGRSPGEYLRHCRLERARRLLHRSRAPLVEIATASGFADQSHFNKAFRRAYGTSPGAFRRA